MCCKVVMHLFRLFHPMLCPRTHLYAHKLIHCLMQLRNNRFSHSLYSISKMNCKFYEMSCASL